MRKFFIEALKTIWKKSLQMKFYVPGIQMKNMPLKSRFVNRSGSIRSNTIISPDFLFFLWIV